MNDTPRTGLGVQHEYMSGNVGRREVTCLRDSEQAKLIELFVNHTTFSGSSCFLEDTFINLLPRVGLIVHGFVVPLTGMQHGRLYYMCRRAIKFLGPPMKYC